MIQAGSTVVYKGTWRTATFKTADGIVAAVASDLLRSGLAVRSQASSAGWLANLPGFLKESFDVTLKIEVDNGLGYNSEQDIISIVRSYVQTETGFPPQSDSIPQIYQPGDDTPTSTGEQSQGNQQQGCVSGTSNDLNGNFSLQCWFSNLTTKGLGTVGIIAILGVVAVGLLVFFAPAVAAKGARKASGAAAGAAAA